MKRIVIGAVIVWFIGTSPIMERITAPTPIAYAKADEPEAKVEPQTLEELVEEKAKEYGVSARVMLAVIDCESSGSTTVRSFIINKKGKREESYGLAQINIPANPEISIEEAINPEFAVDFMAREMAAGNAWKWTCWKNMQ